MKTFILILMGMITLIPMSAGAIWEYVINVELPVGTWVSMYPLIWANWHTYGLPDIGNINISNDLVRTGIAWEGGLTSPPLQSSNPYGVNNWHPIALDDCVSYNLGINGLDHGWIKCWYPGGTIQVSRVVLYNITGTIAEYSG